jgi:hypothetical protein
MTWRLVIWIVAGDTFGREADQDPHHRAAQPPTLPRVRIRGFDLLGCSHNGCLRHRARVTHALANKADLITAGRAKRPPTPPGRGQP